MSKHVFGLAAIAVASMMGTGGASAQVSDVGAAPGKDEAQVYIVTRPDLRKCAYPLCGGWYVKAVNRHATRCADGRVQPECHAVDLDAAALGWSDEDEASFTPGFGKGQALVRGRLALVPQGGAQADTLVIDQAWQGQALSRPQGSFYAVKSNGIVCIAAPCKSIDERRLNYATSYAIAGVDLGASGATADQVAAGSAALFSDGILAAGRHRLVTGPAGWALELVTTEFYLPVVTKKP